MELDDKRLITWTLLDLARALLSSTSLPQLQHPVSFILPSAYSAKRRSRTPQLPWQALMHHEDPD